MAHIDKTNSVCTKINPSLENLKWINNGCKPNSQGMEVQDACLAFPGSLTNLVFIRWVKAFPGYSVNALTMTKNYISLNIKF